MCGIIAIAGKGAAMTCAVIHTGYHGVQGLGKSVPGQPVVADDDRPEGLAGFHRAVWDFLSAVKKEPELLGKIP